MPNNINGATIREVDEDLEDMNSFYNRYPPKQDPREGWRLISNELYEITISLYHISSGVKLIG